MILTIKGTVSRDGLKKTTKEYRKRRRGLARVPTEERTEKYRKGQEVRQDIRKERPEGEEVVFVPKSHTLRGCPVNMKQD